MSTQVASECSRGIDFFSRDTAELVGVLELFFGKGDGTINSFRVDEDGYHLAKEAIAGWQSFDKAPSRSAWAFGHRVTHWLRTQHTELIPGFRAKSEFDPTCHVLGFGELIPEAFAEELGCQVLTITPIDD